MAKTTKKATARKATGSIADQTVPIGWSFRAEAGEELAPIYGIDGSQMGLLSPESARAASLKADASDVQVQLATTFREAIERIGNNHKEIEKLKSEAQQFLFKTKAEEDQFILNALLAKDEYSAHKRVWDELLAEHRKLINSEADEEITTVGLTFADKLRLVKERGQQKRELSRATVDRTIEMIQAETSQKASVKAIDAQAKSRKAFADFIAGKPILALAAPASQQTVTVNSTASSLLDSFGFK
jgi:hypothetical protein